MLHIRVIKTKGDSKSVQVCHYRKGKRVIFKHIGSGSTEQQITILLEMAKVFIADHTKQIGSTAKIMELYFCIKIHYARIY